MVVDDVKNDVMHCFDLQCKSVCCCCLCTSLAQTLCVSCTNTVWTHVCFFLFFGMFSAAIFISHQYFWFSLLTLYSKLPLQQSMIPRLVYILSSTNYYLYSESLHQSMIPGLVYRYYLLLNIRNYYCMHAH